jgi:hypothetical protein
MKFFDITPVEDELSQQSSLRFALNLLDFRRPPQHLHLFPMSSFHTIKGTRAWYTLSFVPISAKKTSVRYDLYTRGDECSHSDMLTERFDSLLVRFNQALEEYQEGYVPIMRIIKDKY